MNFTPSIPERIREKFLKEILEMYSQGELSESRAAQILGVPRAALYKILAETNTPLPKKLNESIKREIKELLSLEE